MRKYQYAPLLHHLLTDMADYPIDEQCATPQQLQTELDALTAVLELGEREDTWEKMERALIRFAGITRGGGYKHLPLFTDGIGRSGLGLAITACVSCQIYQAHTGIL